MIPTLVDFDELSQETNPATEVTVKIDNVNTFNKSTTPAAKFFNKNSDGTYYLDSSIEEITQNADGTISFNFKAATNVAKPTFSPAAGRYIEAQTVTISCATEGATIYYTADGSTPTASSTPYTSPITIEETTTLKAIAVNAGGEESLVATAKYTISNTLLYEGMSNDATEATGTNEIDISNTSLDYSDWESFTKVFKGGTKEAYKNGGCLKLGTSKVAGSMTTRNMGLVGTGTLSFYLKTYSKDSGTMTVTVTGAKADITSFTQTTDWKHCTVTLTEATGNVKITFATTKRAYLDEIELVPGSVPVVTKEEVNMAFSPDVVELTIGDTFTQPTLTTYPVGLQVSYNSSNTDVASVNATTGTVTIHAVGTAVITATFPGDDQYYSGKATYTIVVLEMQTPVDPDPPVVVTNKYELVTDASTLVAGDSILIVCNGASYRKILSTTQNKNNRGAVAFAAFNEDNTITPVTGSAKIELGGEKGKWTFYVTNGETQGYLYAASSNNNYLRTKSSADANAKASISIASGGNATIKFTGSNTRNTILYNTQNKLFSCYSGTSAQTTSVQIYRQVKQEISSGDVNKDGDVSIADITALVNILMGQDAEQVLYDHKAADVDGNGSVEAADVEALLNMILSK